jgi:predicted nucleotidyltransferase
MFEKLLKKLASTLKDHNIPYMIIGGQAVLVYGEPRLTKDIDVTLGIGPDFWEKIKHPIEKIGLKILTENPQEFVKKTFVLPTEDPDSGFRVDFIFSITPYEALAIERAITVQIEDVEIKFTSLEDLVIHKMFAGRPRDIEDIINILEKNPYFDKKYILKWLKKFDLSLSKKFVEEFEEILKNLH